MFDDAAASAPRRVAGRAQFGVVVWHAAGDGLLCSHGDGRERNCRSKLAHYISLPSRGYFHSNIGTIKPKLSHSTRHI